MLGLHMQHEMSESNCSDGQKQNAVFGLDFLDIIGKRNFDSYHPHNFLNSLNHHVSITCVLDISVHYQKADHKQ